MTFYRSFDEYLADPYNPNYEFCFYKYAVIIRTTPGNIISSTDRLVALTLASHVNERNNGTSMARVKYGTLAEECALSERAVGNAMAELKAHGLVSCTKTPRSSIFRLPTLRLKHDCKPDARESRGEAANKRELARLRRDGALPSVRQYPDPFA